MAGAANEHSRRGCAALGVGAIYYSSLPAQAGGGRRASGARAHALTQAGLARSGNCSPPSSRGENGQPPQGELRITVQKLARRKPGSLSASTSAFTFPKVVSGLC